MQKLIHRVWLIGGTSESAILAEAIAQLQIDCIVSVTTESAKSLYPESEFLTIWVGKLEESKISQFINTNKINRILDASHPYAVEISKLAIAISQTHKIPYLRYERLAIVPQNLANIVYLDSVETLLNGDYLTGKRVLLTLGYRILAQFTKWQDQALLFTRILPSSVALDTALKAGFTPDRIIALRPPFSLELETALWQHWQISLVVTKASGSAGGEDIKINLAHQFNIPLIIIQRPLINYPQMTQSFSNAIKFCQPLKGG
ncbi:Cobalt-precorrin-6A reductase [Planktothrix serta PCC 8927]|uniref:Cobalt-precorrin-6A reductase n=1 Tax=Planktothrix serta PCC 8927 TaxID=671068 RepID=A0A7Z9BZS9_9CYAN|nr:cobalt-precorrin-6A reductase [Planktothrix serta]VXD25848.1 Cobalt-precorrin-6A reductase [Planktothrix serta PCC 8927]